MDELEPLDRRGQRKTPAINVHFEEDERQMLDRQCRRYGVSITTYVRTLVVLCERGILKPPIAAFRR
jgi:hypothetical protein